MISLFGRATAGGGAALSNPVAAAHPGLSIGVGWHGLVGALPLTPHGPGSAAAMALVTLGALWTAVELPAAPARLPSRRLSAAVLGVTITTAALLLLAALLVWLLPLRLFAAGWPAALELLIVCAAGGAAVAIGLHVLTRLGLFQRPILVLGDAPEWAAAGATLDPGRGPLFRVADILPADHRRGLTAETLRRRKIWAVVLAGGAGGTDGELRRRCRHAGVRMLAEQDFREQWLGRVDLDRLLPGAIAASRPCKNERLVGIVRRGADIAFAVALLLLTLPLTLLAALLIKIESPGPVLYRQERVGLNGRRFQVIKFRSMRTDAEAGLGPQWAKPADPRVTRIGRFIRLARIDELPQLWNVLRGEMSVIGPRPERPYFVERLAATLPCYDDRAMVKPGITGWAQVKYRYGASIEDARAKLAYDLYYVKHRSLLLDLRILAVTVRVVLLQEGAR
ncbi:MAG TPA: exopolysaccharide biosynthesis polyprenyl glycosylphosphotransferase [Acetobacteraceae bacterium]|jgi:exopolysaccharide biosynthesis polyprenyl glycosylphosphotransferase|nr:exopolysaccharide biosynthesis polyprenyl glycosylphosphotransferase [Acetobacteraceae bacterium]